MSIKINPNCAGHLPFTRRHFLFGSAAAGASLARAEEIGGARVSTRNTARAVVFVNLNGGPSHLDTFDPKDGPWNPRDADIRQSGPFTLSNRFFPKLTRHLDDLLLVRSAAGWEAAHERGQFYMQTAHSQNPALAGETPHIGAVIAREKGGAGLLPPFLSFNQGGLQGAKFLGGLFEPMMPPATRTGITTLSHNHFGAVAQSRERFDRRFALLESLDAPLRQAPMNEAMATYAGYYGRARAMMYNDAVDNIFKFSVEDENRYGATGIGRAAIVTRNAIRANNGAIFFNITQGGWDLHDNQFTAASSIYTLTRDLDNAVSALADDLKATGEFRETLIVVMGEFGRTPGPLNSRSGRDHYRNVQSIAMMGGGIRGGRVIGATDAQGAAITNYGWAGNRPIYPEDVTASIYSALGVDWTKSVLDTPSRRRYDFIVGASEGKFAPVDEFWG
ncbi:MAG: DUF1501 domain-containing protein [Bryobacterales bacterium]|nr:DUF1501 domain-containing protein [Bryobacterales bacterium]